MEYLKTPNQPSKNRAESTFESFESAKKKLARGVISNASLIVGLFILIVAITVLTTDITLTSFVNIASVSLMCCVIFFAAYAMYINTSGAGSRDGLETDVYIKAKSRHEELRQQIIAKKAIGKLPEFCRAYVDNELKNTRMDILARVGIEYEVYEEEYLGKEKKEILKSDLSELEQNAVIVANNVEPIELNADMVFQANNGKRRRSPLGAKPIEVKVKSYITRFLETFAFSAIPAIVVLEVASDFSWATFASVLLKLFPIVAHAFYGYEFGFKYITVYVVDFMNAQSDIMQEFLHSLD